MADHNLLSLLKIIYNFVRSNWDAQNIQLGAAKSSSTHHLVSVPNPQIISYSPHTQQQQQQQQQGQNASQLTSHPPPPIMLAPLMQHGSNPHLPVAVAGAGLPPLPAAVANIQQQTNLKYQPGSSKQQFKNVLSQERPQTPPTAANSANSSTAQLTLINSDEENNENLQGNARTTGAGLSNNQRAHRKSISTTTTNNANNNNNNNNNSNSGYSNKYSSRQHNSHSISSSSLTLSTATSHSSNQLNAKAINNNMSSQHAAATSQYTNTNR